MEVAGFEAMWFAYSEDRVCPSAIYYFVNVLYLEHYPKCYLEFRDKYDNDFLKDLSGEIRKEGQEEVEKVLLIYALYRFLRYVKHDEAKILEYPEIMEINSSDSLVISFMMLLIAGMRALYERYSKGFIIEVSETEYYDALIPDSVNINVSEYAKQLEHAYDKLGKKGEYAGGDAYVHDASLMRTMLYEYYELYICVNNVIHFLVENELSAENDSTADNGDMFVERMHDECVKYIRREENTSSLGTVFAMTNRELLVRLGFFEKGSSILKKSLCRNMCGKQRLIC